VPCLETYRLIPAQTEIIAINVNKNCLFTACISTEGTRSYKSNVLLEFIRLFNLGNSYRVAQKLGSSVSIVTRLPAGQPGIGSRQGQRALSSS
jgi:hypothetical protein